MRTWRTLEAGYARFQFWVGIALVVAIIMVGIAGAVLVRWLRGM